MKRLSRREFFKKAAAMAGHHWLLMSAVGGLAVPVAATAVTAREARASPAEKKPRGKVRHWAFVIDLRKCEGCVTIGTAPGCVQSCIQGHYVPEGQQWIEVYEHELSGGGKYYMPTPCMQCENAPCVNVCPVGARYHNEEGIVLVDQRRCIGCRMCMAACPYQRNFFNWGEPKIPEEAHFVEYSPEFPAPAFRGTVMKCIFCAHNVKVGKLPFCVVGCPMKAIYLGDLNEDVATNGVELVKLSRFLDENNAYRYKEELGTQPRVWYIPGHGEAFGRHPSDRRQKKPNYWPWGGKA